MSNSPYDFDFDEQGNPRPQRPQPPPDPFAQEPFGQPPPPADPYAQQAFGQPQVPYQQGYVSPYPMVGQPPRRMRGLTCGLIALVVGLPLCIVVIVAVAVTGAFGNMFSQLGGAEGIGGLIATISGQLGGPPTIAIEGDPANFDALAGLTQAQQFAGEGALLTAIDAVNVRSDGTLELTASYSPSPHVDYDFILPIERPADAPPVGAGGNSGGQWYQPITIAAYRPGQTSRITTTGGSVSTSIQFVNQGLRKDISSPTTTPFDDPVAAPRCDFGEIWQTAMANDAPRDAVANIEYSADGYDFVISGVISLTFDTECQLVR